jgi:hypothetical protein
MELPRAFTPGAVPFPQTMRLIGLPFKWSLVLLGPERYARGKVKTSRNYAGAASVFCFWVKGRAAYRRLAPRDQKPDNNGILHNVPYGRHAVRDRSPGSACSNRNRGLCFMPGPPR